MEQWPYEVTALQFEEIMEAVKDDCWQEFRLSLKGLSTTEKLKRLEGYLLKVELASKDGNTPRVEQVRIDNYINALLRGGQLVRQGNEIYVQRQHKRNAQWLDTHP